jgi:murein DD-endopeptidase MepM/ murein hydrolase activator NlpD
MNVPLNGARRPAAIGHRVTFEGVVDGMATSGIVRIPDTRVDARDLPLLGPPLRGGPWVAVYHPGWERGHRRVYYAVDGRARLPGRFAIDWMRAGGGDGRGAEALAVADGTVVAVRDDFGGDGGDPPAALENETGNYVAIRIGDGRYAFYEHLAPGVRVRVGQRVRRGEVIGSLGATGHVTQPHLHFHLADANAPLAAESLSYVLRYTPLGAYDTIEAFRAAESWNPHTGSIATPSFPSPMMVVEFPE